MKIISLTSRKVFASVIVMLCALFASPRVLGQTLEAYKVLNPEETTLTFYYDDLRATRTGDTWVIGKRGSMPFMPMRIKKVVFDASFKNFQPTTTARWFANFWALTTFEGLENFNTEKVTDMSNMFEDCRALETLDLKTFNTQNVENLKEMFLMCRALKTVNLESFNTEKVVNMYRMFYVCKSLEALNLKSFNTEKVEVMARMFDGCESLKTLDVTSFNTAKVKDMSALFARCSALPELDLTSFNTANVSDMVYMFKGCSSLKAIDLTHFNTANVEGMSGMFEGCSALKAIDLTSFNTANVEGMSKMFKGCAALEAIDLTHFNTANVAGMNEMFEGCAALKTLDLRTFNTEKVTVMTGMFKDCAELTDIISEKAWQCEESEDMFKGCVRLKGAVAYDDKKTDVKMANPETGYFVHNKPTALGQVLFNSRNSQGIYTLQGKRVKTAFRHLPAGVYIVNGKKMVR